jgi:hypothetical protein
MKFATWKVYFPNGSKEGNTPDLIIRERGHSASGLIHLEPFKILGTFSNDADTSGLDEYEFTEITQELAMNLILAKDSGATINELGEVTFSPYVKE